VRNSLTIVVERREVCWMVLPESAFVGLAVGFLFRNIRNPIANLGRDEKRRPQKATLGCSSSFSRVLYSAAKVLLSINLWMAE
jgi:hypothetical protein